MLTPSRSSSSIGVARTAPAIRLWAAVLCAVGVSAGLAVPASAQVIEIGPGGASTIYDRPAVFETDGVTPIPARARTGTGVAARAARSADLVADAAGAAELSPELIEAMAWRESRGRAGAVSGKGALGEMQLMPGTARSLHVDPRDSRQNYRGGAAYMRLMMARYDGDIVRALAAYNAGAGAVDRYGGVPPYRETRAYVAAIMDRLSRRADEAGR